MYAHFLIRGYSCVCLQVNQPSGSENNIPLTLACWKGHCDVVELLLHFNSELEHRNKAGCSPLMLASREGHFEATYLLLKHGAQLNEPSGGNDDTPLTLACWKGHERVVRLLLEYRSTIDHQTKTGCTPLMEATREGHDRVVKMLLENQADVETPDNYGQSPLFMACWKGHSDVANLLLCYGANRECRTKTGITPLFQACRENHVEVVRLLLLSGCSVNSPFPNSRECPLTLAAEKGFVELVDLLLSRDALVDCRTKKGSTPFFLACKDGHLEIAKALSESGAAVETSDHRNTTPLLASFRNGHCHVVDWLLKQVSHLPSDEECRKTLTPSSSNNDKELQSAKNRCMELIRKAKHAKERAAMHVAKILCDEVDAEKEKRLNKQKALARKKSKRKEKKKLKKEISSDLPPKSDPIPCSPSIHIPAPSEEHTYSTSAPEKLYPSHSISLLTSARPTTPPHFPIPPSQEYILAARRLSPPSPLPSDFPVAPVLLTAVSSVESLDTASDHAPVHDDRDSSFSDYEDSEVYLPGEHDAYYSNGSNYSDPLDAHSSLDPSTPLSMSTAPHAYSPSHSPLNSLSRITGDLTPPDSPVSSAILYLDPPSRGICPQQEATHPLSVRAQLPHSLKQPKLDSSYETADTHFRPRAPSLRSNPPSKHHKAARQDPWSPKNTPPAPWSKHYPSLPTDHTDSHPHTAVQVPPLSPATYSQVTSSTLSHRPSPPLYPLRPSPATHRDKLACNSPTPQTHSKYAPADSPLPDPGEKPPSRADSFPDTRGSEEEGEILRGTKNLQVSVSNSLVGRIIGKAGSRINQITNISGAHIHVSKPNSKSQERIITIKGTDRSLGIAKYLINEALSTPDKDIDFHQIAEGDRLNGREEEMFDSHKETTMDTSHLKSLTSSQSSLIPAPREVELECEQVPPVESTPNEVTRQQEVPDSCRPSSNPAPDTTPLSEPVLPSCSIETQKSYGAIGQEVCSRFGSTTSPPAPLSDPPLSDPPLNHQNSCPQHALFDPAFERGFGPIGAPPHPFNPSLPPVHPSRPFIKLHKRSEPPLNYIQNGILPHPHLHSSLSISPEPLSSPLPILTSSVWNFDPPSLSSNSNDLTWWSPVGINLNSNNQWNGSPLLNDRVHSKDTKDTASADADTNNHQTTDGESEEGSTNKPPRGRPSNGLTPEAVRKLFGTKDWASRSMNEGVPVSRILKELEKNCLPDCDAELEQLILLPEEEWKSLGIPIGRRVKLRALSQSVHKYLQTKHVNNNNNNNIRENEGGSQPTQERL